MYEKILSFLIISLLTFNFIFAIEIQDPSGEEVFVIKEQVKDQNLNQQPLQADMFWYNTLGAFGMLLTILITGGYSYITAIKNKRIGLFGTQKNKIKNV